MNKMILALVALCALVIATGCDPFGSEETKAYIRGTVFIDEAMTVPAEGVTIELLVDADTSAFVSQTTMTNASGNFMMEVQFYPLPYDPESGIGYSMPEKEHAGLIAYYGSLSYMYKPVTNGFVLHPGDTLDVWDVSVSSFTSGGSQ
ncbi:hypothetical protein CSA37_05970 [Candidatus Fermentibacteria bacterium]|nr:MAG: hypothetical protein CSA37_05970 [Candidatus Fermentibacteria bacterium]